MIARIRKSIEEKDEGFTLIELLVVIIIIGILAAIAIPVFLNQRKKATEASMKSDARTAANEMETYFVDANDYSALDGVDLTNAGVTGFNDVVASKNNTVTATSATVNDFCITVENVDTTITPVYYNSATGGLTTTAC